MGARSDFWLYVHELNRCLDAEGETGDDRRENILRSLADMPPMAREQVAHEMRYLVTELCVLNESLKDASDTDLARATNQPR
ncbi:MAG: hypothetical protein L0211_06160 [Planctomycetaceae bacterium]|nr:hypothetical protein [Planctomycetaceae bacterium]